MHIHILGICGTFMGGIAALAKAAGHEVTGCDAGIYPPMSTQLRKLDIDIHEGFGADQLESPPDCVVVGNVVSRGFDVVEAMLDRDIPFQSGPQWLAENVLRGQHVFAVAGTHGKTTTASLLAWILEDAGLQPGFLIGGIPASFGVSARFGGGNCFVVEADEYDTAFFDKRAKFVHYRPRTLILNNLEYDHADIYRDLGAVNSSMPRNAASVSWIPGAARASRVGTSAARTISKTPWLRSRPHTRQVSNSRRPWMPCPGSMASSGAWSEPLPWATSRSTTISPIIPRRSGARSRR
jgi:UDP-N-acetylmuramate:L-alanyl-gamma-D-glutamyl-meso-diaminopimelate ligase